MLPASRSHLRDDPAFACRFAVFFQAFTARNDSLGGAGGLVEIALAKRATIRQFT
jgi:hypothetical protein